MSDVDQTKPSLIARTAAWVEELAVNAVPLPEAGPQRLIVGGAETRWTEFTGHAWAREVRLAAALAGSSSSDVPGTRAPSGSACCCRSSC